ncbi:Dolichyldiphosphatase [Wickerhamomyces ciferrii]|uniref:Dolichyldiphosphatase n=1 Tax=Wickerhamomyces ciferrii (strain ATCC 14091 / BCRC 22168 / CBS 111 / JCM 3599 / NBRC 0793 / NRRL Y-1031 F-60-10) TaxID=1206466 RepID=K0KUF5_WICCF|nr:Dolichyldiphosphatase [Wickerhamomyces ciferrii]CCH45627.1 Dolichyldiphosphatase [Wickerhamomyces ciferrii]
MSEPKFLINNMTSLNYNPVPFDDTYVLYDPQDPISTISVYFSLLPIGILIFYLSWFIVTREIEPVIIAGGQVVNDIINNIVKNIIKEERPLAIDGFQSNGLRSGYGMPSAHSQFMGFFAIFFTLKIWLNWKDLTCIRKILGTLGVYILGSLVAFSRVYLYYHSYKQVAVGVLLGTAIGAPYFLVTSIARSLGLIDWIISWKIVNLFWVKDSTFHSPLTLKEEYQLWEQIKENQVNKKHK